MFFNKFFNSVSKIDKKVVAISYAAPLGTMFTGEKDFMAMGPVKRYNVNNYIMATRAMDLYITNDFTRSCVQRFAQFAIGLGLQLHAEPQKDFLRKKYNVVLPDDFTKDTETLWELWKINKNVSTDKQSNLDNLAYKIFVNAIISGDILVIKRVDNGNLNYQIIDGRNVFYPSNINTDTNNRVLMGVEVNDQGEHVAYHIKQEDLTYKRVEAKDKKGRLIAWLVYADDNRVGSTRGLSPLGAIMQKLDQLGKYAENEVVASNTNSKFCATIEHDSNSTGKNPLAKGLNLRRLIPEIVDTTTALGEQIAERMRNLTNGLIMNLGIGQKLNSFDTKRPNVNYEKFLDANAKYMFASLGLPFEVVLMVFQNNFSASRASLKMFEIILKVMRKHIIIDGFYYIVYQHWFELEVLKGNIDAPKFLELRNKTAYEVNAYYKSRFVGTPIPHIDPVKEVNAVVTKLNNGLSTFEMALEELGNNLDFDAMAEKLKTELDKFKKLGLKFIAGTGFSGYEESDDDDNLDDKKNSEEK